MIIKSIFSQYFSKIITFPLSLVIYSLIVKSLSIDEFKDYNLFLAVALYMIGFMDLGLSNFFYREAITKKKYYFFNILFSFKIVTFFIVIIIYFLYFNFFNNTITFFILLYVFLSILKDILEKLLRSFSHFDYIAYVNIGAIFFKFLLILGLYYNNFLFLKLLLITLSLVLSFYIVSYKSLLTKKLKKAFIFRVSLKYFIFSTLFIKKNLRYIAPWIIIFLGNLIFSRLDLFMLNHFDFSYDVAEYSSSYSLYEKLEFFLLTISMVFYNVFANKKDIKIFSNILDIITLISLFFVVILLISSNFLVNLIIGDKYQNANNLFIIMVLGTYFKFHSTFFVNWLYLHKKELEVGVAIILMLLLNGVLNYIYIPLYRDIGATYTTFISDIFNFLFLIVIMYKNNFNFISKYYLFFNLLYIIAIFYFLIIRNNMNIEILFMILLLSITIFLKNIRDYKLLKGIL